MCVICGFVYDEEEGWPEDGIKPGTKWEDVPDDWICPDCGVGKDDFDMIEFQEITMQTQEDLPVNIKGHDKVNDLKKYWDALVSKHRKLDNEIKEAYKAYRPDQTIKNLKLNKLHLKQETEIIKKELGDLLDSIRKY